MALHLAPHLRAGSRVLDVGCGSMDIGCEVLKILPLRWVGVDTLDYHPEGLEFHHYDGCTLPFTDGEFDAVLLCFVLHHCEDLRPLEESLRVCQGRILVVEDVIRYGILGLALAKAHDWICNKLLEPDMALPYRFRSESGWNSVFGSFGLCVVHRQSLHSQPLALVPQVLFVLERSLVKDDHAAAQA